MTHKGNQRLLKWLAFGLFGLVILILMVATIVEKLYGTEFALATIYKSWWMVSLWAVATIAALCYVWREGLHRRWRILLLHLSFVVILIGAMVSYVTGREGRVHLRVDQSVGSFEIHGGESEEFPFDLRIEEFELQYYPGTFAPMDYLSHVVVVDNGAETRDVISMNNIMRYRGYRLCQSGYDPDGLGATLSVAYDPYGIAITYCGYALLLLSILLFFIEPHSVFRSLLKHRSLKRLGVVLAFVFATALPTHATASDAALPETLSKQSAERFCDIYVYYNDRIAPLQTLAIEFTTKLYGSSSYRGLSAEQVLTGWFFFYDDWKHEPMIKIKGDDIAALLSIDGSYASLTDFTDRNGYKLDAALRGELDVSRSNAELANEKFNLVSMLCMGTLFKIYPCRDPATDTVTWYSMSDTLPSTIPYEQWLFIGQSMNLVAEQVMMRNDAEIERLMGKIRKYQEREAAGQLPSLARFEAEKLYNSIGWNRPLAMASLTLGIVCFLLFCFVRNATLLRWLRRCLYVVMVALGLYLTVHIALRWYVSGHVPLSNGYETMQFMSWCSVVLTLTLVRKFHLALPFGLLLVGFTLLVAMMGEASPRITQLMPVLQSPLLSIHVMVIMIAYTLLAFMMLNGISAVVLKLSRRDATEDVERLYVVSRIMLYPALFLLAIGIFIGAIWANVSWGRYWGWDPKEVWALITMLIYAALIHAGSLPMLRRPMVFHVLTIVAFLSVVVTYFGVNFLLGGMHSYA